MPGHRPVSRGFSEMLRDFFLYRQVHHDYTHSYLADVSDIFNFFCSGEGKRESEAPGRGGGDLLKIPGGGCLPGGLGRGGEGPGGCLRGFWGGGAKYFFFGAEIPTKLKLLREVAPRASSR